LHPSKHSLWPTTHLWGKIYGDFSTADLLCSLILQLLSLKEKIEENPKSPSAIHKVLATVLSMINKCRKNSSENGHLQSGRTIGEIDPLTRPMVQAHFPYPPADSLVVT
jgi:hypothetical protein